MPKKKNERSKKTTKKEKELVEDFRGPPAKIEIIDLDKDDSNSKMKKVSFDEPDSNPKSEKKDEDEDQRRTTAEDMMDIDSGAAVQGEGLDHQNENLKIGQPPNFNESGILEDDPLN